MTFEEAIKQYTENLDKYQQLEKIQKSLLFISKGLENKIDNPETLNFFRCQIIAYLKELQYNKIVPKEINLDQAVFIDYDRRNKIAFVNFSKELEDFLTDNGNFMASDFEEEVLVKEEEDGNTKNRK